MEFGEVVQRASERKGQPVPNMDPDTGVFYGVASGAEIPEWFWEECEGFYHCSCPNCGEDLADLDTDSLESCPNCAYSPDDSSEWYGDEAASHYINTETLQAETSHDGTIVMVYKSSNIVECRECSPCYPCAGDLGSIGEGNKRTYGFPVD